MYYISLSSFNNDSKASFLYNDIHHKHWLLVISNCEHAQKSILQQMFSQGPNITLAKHQMRIKAGFEEIKFANG